MRGSLSHVSHTPSGVRDPFTPSKVMTKGHAAPDWSGYAGRRYSATECLASAATTEAASVPKENGEKQKKEARSMVEQMVAVRLARVDGQPAQSPRSTTVASAPRVRSPASVAAPSTPVRSHVPIFNGTTTPAGRTATPAGRAAAAKLQAPLSRPATREELHDQMVVLKRRLAEGAAVSERAATRYASDCELLQRELNECEARERRAVVAEAEQRALALAKGELEVRLRQALATQGKQLTEAMAAEAAAQGVLSARSAEKEELSRLLRAAQQQACRAQPHLRCAHERLASNCPAPGPALPPATDPLPTTRRAGRTPAQARRRGRARLERSTGGTGGGAWNAGGVRTLERGARKDEAGAGGGAGAVSQGDVGKGTRAGDKCEGEARLCQRKAHDDKAGKLGWGDGTGGLGWDDRTGVRRLGVSGWDVRRGQHSQCGVWWESGRRLYASRISRRRAREHSAPPGCMQAEASQATASRELSLLRERLDALRSANTQLETRVRGLTDEKLTDQSRASTLQVLSSKYALDRS